MARKHGRHRNLLVSATGTGKTVMAAVDYARLRTRLHRSRLLFVAHREEILEQSRQTFRHAIRDHNFGEKWVGRARPTRFDHIFASIQSLNAAGVSAIPSDHFDVVIIDEFHHAAAPSYRRILEHLDPQELLGLTATPERSDGLPVLDWFDGRIAAELRLWDAIDQHRLAPFAYFGISDGTDLRNVPWRRGQGYDIDALSSVYTGNDAWARVVLRQLQRQLGNLSSMRCLGFCVSVAHARFMAEHFTTHGVSATAVWGETPADERSAALDGLRDGSVNAVFSVDLFNEGVDVPTVDVLLMLRPTESATLFLQQLGRGLRQAHGKSICTVLDFIGNHRREFRFDRRFRALLGVSRPRLREAIETGFPFLPAGSHMELDSVSSAQVLRSLRDAIPSRWSDKVRELRDIFLERGSVSLGGYLEATGLDLEDVYTDSRGWSDLCQAAGLPIEPPGPHEVALRRAVGRMLHVDDEQRLDTFRRMLRATAPPRITGLSPAERRLARMLISGFPSDALPIDRSLGSALAAIWEHPQVRLDLCELFDVLRSRHQSPPLAFV